MNRIVALLLTFIFAHAQAASVFPGPSGTLQTITSKGLLVRGGWVTNDRDNYVVNPDGFVNNSGITVSGATATKQIFGGSALGENGHMQIGLTAVSTAVAQWAVRSLSPGLKGQQCTVAIQAYNLSISGTSVPEIRVTQNAVIVARMDLTISTTAQPLLLPVPCGDATQIASTTVDVGFRTWTSGTATFNVSGLFYGDIRKSGQFGDAANVTAWRTTTSWTPSTGSKGTTTTDSLRYARIGDTAHFRWDYVQTAAGTAGSGAYTFTLPDSLVADSSKVTFGTASDANGRVGRALVYDGTSALEGEVYLVNSTQIQVRDMPGASNFAGGAAQNFGDTNLTISFYDVFIPIANWPTASSAVTPARSETEYASNTSTADSTDTTSFANGVDGSPTPGALTAFRRKRVRFQTPIQATDSLFVEVRVGSSGAWRPLTAVDGATGIQPFTIQSGVTYGVGINTSAVNSTDLDIDFGQYFHASGAFGVAGSSWPLAGSRWRVRKGPAGPTSPVFIQSPVRAAGTGTAPLENEVGYRVIATRTTAVSQSAPVLGTWYDVTSLTHTLSAGGWDLETQCSVGADYSSGGGYAMPSIAIRTSAGTVLATGISGFAGDPAAATAPPRFWYGSPRAATRVNILTPTTYKTSMAVNGFSGTPVFASVDARGDLAGGTECYLEAVRAFDR